MKKQGKRIKDPELIFANDEPLRETITELKDFLEARLPEADGRYFCLDKLNDDYDLRWFFTFRFCDMMGIGDNFVPMLNEYVAPTCEGELVNQFTVEDVIKLVHQYKEENQK